MSQQTCKSGYFQRRLLESSPRRTRSAHSPNGAGEISDAQQGLAVWEGSPSVRASGDVIQSQATSARDDHPAREREAEQMFLVALGDGDQSAFWPLWEMHSSSLYRICLREMNSNRADAEDALAQAMMKALNKLPIFARQITNPKAWLIRLTSNHCKDIHRGRGRCQKIAGRLKRIDEVFHVSDMYECPTVSKKGLSRCELEDDPQFTMNHLPGRLREVFMLRFLREMSYKDIATRLVLTQVNVRKRIQQARAILRALRNNGIRGTETQWSNCSPREPATATTVTGKKAALHVHKESEIPVHSAFSRTVRVKLPSGVERHFEIFLDKKPVRNGQKIETLRKYVARHPGGGKNRLKLADLLYETGTWVEAVECYREVLTKQPWLVPVSVRLGEILRLIATDDEAIAVYELPIPLMRHGASRCHLKGLIASCRNDFPIAVASFHEAAILEPDNPAHWHALAEAQRLSGSPDAMLRAHDEALRINPDDLVALSGGHDALLGVGRLAEAWQRVDHVLDLAPHNVTARRRLAERRPSPLGAL